MTDNAPSAASLAAAEAIFEAHQAKALAASPLRDMPTWIRTGAFPTAAQFAAVGLTADTPEDRWFMARKGYIRTYGFSIPCREAIDALVPLAPWVEVGAGSGYWTAALRNAGADIIATDIVVEGSPGYHMTAAVHSSMVQLDGAAAVAAYPERNVFCSWPTRGDDWCAVAAARIAPGKRLAIVGTERGGVTGSDSLFDILEASFRVEREIKLPLFPGFGGSLKVYLRV